GLAIYFAPRAMSECACALPIVWAFALALSPDPRRWRWLLAASLLGFAVLLRLQSGLFCVALLAMLLARRQRRAALESFGVLMIWALIYGATDKLGWGEWFHSALVYLRFNFVEGRSSQFGTAPPAYYSRALL